jgi:hypothetical protein
VPIDSPMSWAVKGIGPIKSTRASRAELLAATQWSSAIEHLELGRTGAAIAGQDGRIGHAPDMVVGGPGEAAFDRSGAAAATTCHVLLTHIIERDHPDNRPPIARYRPLLKLLIDTLVGVSLKQAFDRL